MTRRPRLVLSAMAALTFALSGAAVTSPPAEADTVYYPGDGSWNGKVVYLSRACHDGGDGIPGGPCITNTGCSGYSENTESVAMSMAATYGSGDGVNLLERGYRVVIGTGTLRENIEHSNTRNIAAHVPLHSNAQGSGACGGSTLPGHNGTWGLYKPSRGGQVRCSEILVSKVGGLSRGSGDRTVSRTDLLELDDVDAATCYSEAEFHTWTAGKNWLQDETDWAHRIGSTVDTYLGFP